MSLLLLKSRPLVVIPELAVRLGLNEAMLLQQIQYWLTETTSGVEYDGSRWIYNTVEEWKNQFPFFSESTIKRAFTNLKKQGVLRIEQINKSNHDRTNYYAINYDHHLLTDEVNMTQSNDDNSSNRIVQNDLIDKRKLKPSNSSKCTVLNGSKWPVLTENTTEITSESTTETDHSSQNSGESSDQPKNDFLTRYPEAVIYSANFQKWGDEGDLKTAKWMFGRVKKLNPSALEPTWYDWTNDIRLMRQIDGRTHEQICALFDWANKDSFWHQNILSPRKLRKHFDELIVRSQKPKDEPKVQIDTVERDSAFSRLIGSRSKPQNRIEEIALELAGKTGIRRMSEFSGRQAWNSIWKQATEMSQEAQ